MSKPDDIPQDIRLIATDLILSGPVSGDLDDVCEFEEAIARAILAAKAEEREACADICDQWLAMFGERGDELQHTSPQEWANSAVEDIAAAIRKGGGT